MAVDDLRVTKYDDDLDVVLDVAFAANGEDGQGVLPGGTTGQTLKKLTDADFDTFWDDPTAGVPTDGTAGQVLTKLSALPLDTAWVNVPPGVPVGGAAGAVLTKLSSADYNMVWAAPASPAGYAQLAVANTFTAVNTFNAGIVLPTAPLTFGTASPDGLTKLWYDNGYLNVINSVWGGAIQIWGPGVTDPATVVDGQLLGLAHDDVDKFFITALNYGTAPVAHVWLQDWDFGGSGTDNHLVAWNDNTQDIGVLTAAPYRGRIRNIYAATSVNTPTIVMPGEDESAMITMGIGGANGDVLVHPDYGWLGIQNQTFGGGITVYGLGSVPTGTFGQSMSIAYEETDRFAISAGRWGGTGNHPELFIQHWNFGTLSGSSMTNEVNNTFDIGILVPTATKGNPRNIYAGTAFYEAGVALSVSYAKLAAAGNVFTGGPITLNRSAVASSADIFFNVATLQTSYVNFQQAGVMRWRIGKGSSAEGGSGVTSTGSNFNLQAYDNAGTLVGTAFTVVRGSMVVDFAVTPTVLGVPIGGGGGGQPLDATLTALAALDATAGFVEQTGADAFTKFTVTTAGKALLDDADNTTQRTTLGLGTAAIRNTGTSGTNVIPILNGVNTWTGAQTFAAISSTAITENGTLLTAKYLLQSSYTAADVLTKLLTVDGAGSGIDADLLDGKNIGTTGNTIPLLDGANTWSAIQTFSVSPTAPTLGAGDNTTKLATTAFVTAAVGVGGGGVSLSTPNTWTALQSFTTASGLGLEVISTDLGATVGPIISLKRNSTTPAVDDVIAGLWFQGNDSTPTMQVYSSITSKIVDITPASFDAKLQLQTAVGSTVLNILTLGPGAAVGTAVDQGVNTLNVGTLYENAVSLSAKYAQLDVANTFILGQTINMGQTLPSQALTLISEWDSASYGPTLDICRYSATPAAADKIGAIRFMGKDSVAANNVYASIEVEIVDITNNSEDAKLYIRAITAGSTTIATATFENGLIIGSPTGGDKGVATLNATALYEAGTALSAKYLLQTNYTAADVLAKLLTVDGVGSGIDADLLDGQNSAAFALASSLASYAPIVHTHAIADVTSLQATLDDKASLTTANTFTTPQTINIGTTLPATCLTLISTDSGSGAGPFLYLYRLSADPAANDFIGQIVFQGRNSGNFLHSYAYIAAKITDHTDNAEDSIVTISTIVAGSVVAPATFGAGIFVGTTTGGDKGVNTFNAATIYENNVTLATKYEALGVVAGINTQAASYTLVLADAGKVVEVNNASANTLTIPPNSTVAFPINTRIDVAQYGAGQTTITAGAGVTIRQREAKLKLTGQYAGASLYKRGTDEWVLFGDVSA